MILRNKMQRICIFNKIPLFRFCKNEDYNENYNWIHNSENFGMEGLVHLGISTFVSYHVCSILIGLYLHI